MEDLFKIRAIAIAEIDREIDCAIAGINSVNKLNFYLYKDDPAMPEYQCIRALKMSDPQTLKSEIERCFDRYRSQRTNNPLYRECKAIAVELTAYTIGDRIKNSRADLLDAIGLRL